MPVRSLNATEPFIGLPRSTDWGYPDARAWVPVICTKLNPTTLTWGADVGSGATDLTYPDALT